MVSCTGTALHILIIFLVIKGSGGIISVTCSATAVQLEVYCSDWPTGQKITTAERRFGSPPTEKMIREWRKQREDLIKADSRKKNFTFMCS